jgi:DNA-directed RNA polymerase specialized sigma24 family protein
LNRFRNIDWARLYKVLVIHAACALRRYKGSDSFDGEDCEDIADEVLKDFYESPDALGWKESKGKLETFLGRIVHNKLVDRLRRQKHIGHSLDDANRLMPIQKQVMGVAPERAKTDTKAALYGQVRGDKELEDLIAAAELIAGGPNVNQELGEVLNKTPRQISKLKERLLAIEGVKEIYAARQAAKSVKPGT